MQIQLKQAEIITALKQYIVNEGINLAGKEVAISFTAGRRETGISADIDIQESEAITGQEYFQVSPADRLNVTSIARMDHPQEAEMEEEKPPFEGGIALGTSEPKTNSSVSLFN